MPRSIVERAAHILTQLEQKSVEGNESADGVKANQADTQQIAPENYQLSIFETVDPTLGKLKEQLQDLQINSMTPIECMMKLNELKKLLDD